MIRAILIASSFAWASPKTQSLKVRYFWGAGKIPFSNDIRLEGGTGKVISFGNSAEGKFEKKCLEAVLQPAVIDTLKEYIISNGLSMPLENKNDDGLVCEGSEWLEITIGRSTIRHYKPCKKTWNPTDSTMSNHIDHVSGYLGSRINSRGHECQDSD